MNAGDVLQYKPRKNINLKKKEHPPTRQYSVQRQLILMRRMRIGR